MSRSPPIPVPATILEHAEIEHATPEPKVDVRPAETEARLREERLTLLYQTNGPTVVAGMVIAVLFGWMFWSLVSHWLVIAWVSAVMVTQIGRIALVMAYRRALRRQAFLRPEVWARRQTWAHVVVGLAWGLGAAAVIPQVSIVHQAIILLFFGGAATAGIFVAMHLPAYLAYLGATTIPCTLSIALYADGDARLLALMLVLYMAVAVLTGRQVGALANRILRLRIDNEQLVSELRLLASTDPLTGIANRREFIKRAGETLNRARESNASAALLIFDLDRFKVINDTHGHAVGDEVLRATTAAALRILRSHDLIGRVGGEEFAILLGRISAEEAAGIAERLRHEVQTAAIDGGASGSINVTASFGVANAGDNDYDLLQMLKAADGRLYEAKREGGNAVISGATR